MAFQISRFLRAEFESADGLIAECAQHDLPAPNRDAALKWFSRGSVPGHWLAVLILCLELRSRRPVSLRGYFIAGGTDGIDN